MNLNELDTFNLGDAVKFHKELNPVIFDGDHMKPEVRTQLLLIAQDFVDHLGINHLDISDITISGSSAAYSYTPHSDIDLHILVDMGKFKNDDVYRELFDAKKVVYNDAHDINIGGFDVELYVQDTNQPVVSLGEYSVKDDKWIRLPRKRRANFDQQATKLKYQKLYKLAEFAVKSSDANKIQNVLRTIKKYRQAGLDLNGEFGPENLAYKALRTKGVIEALYKKLDDLHSKKLSLPENKKTVKPIIKDKLEDSLFKEFEKFKAEDYDPNGRPPGPEFKPTMPAGTVRVDVSDVYDWYKLGMHISDLEGLGKHDFGKGPPSTIFSFGSEPEEHKYIKNLEKTGLTTTDIDPKDPNQPKGMKRQKVDPTYNVNETFNKPYSIKWEKGEHGDYDALTKLDDGTFLSIMFNNEYKNTWMVEFYRNNSQEVTGEGDAQRIFATVLTAIAQFIKKKKPVSLFFSAVKEDDPKGSRARLYNTLVNRYANKLGYSVTTRNDDRGMSFKLTKQVTEASGYIPSEREKNDPRFKTALTIDVRPNSIKKNAKAFGFKVSRAGIPPLLR